MKCDNSKKNGTNRRTRATNKKKTKKTKKVKITKEPMAAPEPIKKVKKIDHKSNLIKCFSILVQYVDANKEKNGHFKKDSSIK